MEDNKNIDKVSSDIRTHTHDGNNSKKLKIYNIIPNFTMTPAELTDYLSKGAIEGEEFNVFDGTDYFKYIRINNEWKKIKLT